LLITSVAFVTVRLGETMTLAPTKE
jgi:hypothetical protein